MLISRSHRGFSLIELMVVVVITGIMLAYGVPAFSTWIVNTHIRSVTTDFYTGLQEAKSEAVSQNAQVRFQSVTSLDSSCATSTAGANWVVNLVATGDTIDGKCGNAVDGTTAPFILAKRPVDSDATVAVAATNSSVIFNSLGKLSTVPSASYTYDFTASSHGGCYSNGGDLTCLRVIISPSGEVRMCNPRFPAGDPQGCS